MGELKRMHNGVVVGEPGRRTLNEAIRKDTSPEAAKNKTWDKRRVLFVMSNGWYIEAVDTQEDATRLGQRGGGCVGSLFKQGTYWGDKYVPGSIKILRMVDSEGTAKGLITLGRDDIYGEWYRGKKNGSGGPSYATCNDMGVPRNRPVTIDGHVWHPLEALAIKPGTCYGGPFPADLKGELLRFHSRYCRDEEVVIAGDAQEEEEEDD